MKKVPIIPETEIRINNIRGFYIRKVTRLGTSASQTNKNGCDKIKYSWRRGRYKKNDAFHSFGNRNRYEKA